MGKMKKAFDTESMYKKIMPSSAQSPPIEHVPDRKNEGITEEKAPKLTTVMKKTEIQENSPEKVSNQTVTEAVFDVLDESEKQRGESALPFVGESSVKRSPEPERREELLSEETSVQQTAPSPEAAFTTQDSTAHVLHEEEQPRIYNIMEKLVEEKTLMAVEKMQCCKCSMCRQDIAALALNQLGTKYVVGTARDVENDLIELRAAKGMEVTTAVLRAVLIVRRNPRHELREELKEL